MLHDYNPSTWDAGSGGWRVRGQFRPHNNFKDSLRYINEILSPKSSKIFKK
jgi:hypothetical protein